MGMLNGTGGERKRRKRERDRERGGEREAGRESLFVCRERSKLCRRGERCAFIGPVISGSTPFCLQPLTPFLLPLFSSPSFSVSPRLMNNAAKHHCVRALRRRKMKPHGARHFVSMSKRNQHPTLPPT
ncbi:hypothetical protein JZ751_019232 [Albula glossodonta]|uniref:Uncharacterized protein n=1 Tax=Albula glossodonta TaxID=121402 RepID=A0A8T2NKZ4_9TELE|nr:hypothetical protein JZ751_019232 [Albula glossodonta]